jgi:hypothetical protein
MSTESAPTALSDSAVAEEVTARIAANRTDRLVAEAAARTTPQVAKLVTKETPLELKLLANGIKHPVLLVQAAAQVGLPLEYACADVMMESAGGYNLFGHDPGAWQGMYANRGFVTEPLYSEYRDLVHRGESGLQGVGPCQLTSNALQQEADALGGCWAKEHNMHVGFLFLYQLQREFGAEGGFVHYNGSGPAAEAYGARAIGYADEFARIIG